MIFGSQRALMGGAGALSSMDKAIDIVKARSMQCFWFFIIQLVSFHFSSFLLLFVCYDLMQAVVVGIVLIAFFIIFMQNGLELYSLLHLSDEEATTNKLMQRDSEVPADKQMDSGSKVQ
jgi:uncharacterized membrane protein